MWQPAIDRGGRHRSWTRGDRFKRASLADEWRVTVHGADTTVGESPVVTDIPASVPKGVYQLQAESGGDPLSPGLRAR